MDYSCDNLSVPHEDGGHSIKGGFVKFGSLTGAVITLHWEYSMRVYEGRVPSIVDGCYESEHGATEIRVKFNRGTSQLAMASEKGKAWVVRKIIGAVEPSTEFAIGDRAPFETTCPISG
jgi:hypothetical protein